MIVTVVVIVAFENFFEDAVHIVQQVRVGAFKDVFGVIVAFEDGRRARIVVVAVSAVGRHVRARSLAMAAAGIARDVAG